MMEDNEHTVAKTLWSETLIDALIVGLQKKVPDAKIRELLEELKSKGYENTYIINKVTKELDSGMAMRVRQLIR